MAQPAPDNDRQEAARRHLADEARGPSADPPEEGGRGRHGPGHGAGRRRPRARCAGWSRRPGRRCGSARRWPVSPARSRGGPANWPASWARSPSGRSELAPGKKDKRFADPAWTGNPLLRRAMQAHLATARTAWELIEDADLDWQDDERIRFTATNIVDALAPSNVPGGQPAVAEGGRSTPAGGAPSRDCGGWCATWPPRRGCRRWSSRTPSPWARTSPPPRAPSSSATDVFELIQYRPTTETVRAVPLLMVPPTINKFYIADLAPGRSIVEHYVSRRPAGLHDVLAQPGRAARRLGPGHLRPGRHRRDGRRRAGHRAASRSPLQAFCSGGIITVDGAGAPGRDRAPGPGDRRSASPSRSWTGRGPAPSRR